MAEGVRGVNEGGGPVVERRVPGGTPPSLQGGEALKESRCKALSMTAPPLKISTLHASDESAMNPR